LTQHRRYGDAGQAFPIYLTVVAGLLFLAFAYFAVGQAAVNRNGAQTAADAAALAAAQDTRDKLAGEWVKDVLDPTKWQDIFAGKTIEFGGCERASELAAANDADLTACQGGVLRYDVKVQTRKTMGRSVVPITEKTRSNASAAAVIEPLCQPLAAGSGPDALPGLTCKNGVNWEVDPKHPTDLPKPQDLFDVHLADQ
jgi:Flp pilus assembly protein TadG